MDLIGGVRIQYFSEDQIVDAWRKSPCLLENKKFKELFIGYLVAAAERSFVGVNLMIGFPLKETSIDKMPAAESLEQFINNAESIDDSDVDIFIGTKEEVYYRCQITRLVAVGKRDITTEELIPLLSKKCIIQPDKKLILIINVECDCIIDIEKLGKANSAMSVPYGSIFIFGKADLDYGNFKWWKLFPQIIEGKEFSIRMPL